MPRVIQDRDGMWLRAEWSDKTCQWESEDLPIEMRITGYRYSFGKTLAHLRKAGVRTYSSEDAAQVGTSDYSIKR